MRAAAIRGLTAPATGRDLVLVALVVLVGVGLAAPTARAAAPTQAAAVPADGPVALSVRLGRHSDKTRFVLETTARLRYIVLPQRAPDHVAIEFDALDWPQPLTPPGRRGLVAGVDPRRLTGGRMRVGLRLDSPGRIGQAFSIAPRGGHLWRFVVDLVPATAPVRSGVIADAPIDLEALIGAAAATPPPRPVAPPGRAGDPAAADRSPERAPPPRGSEPRPGAKPAGRRRPVIVLDPGHGGVDPGAVGVGNVFEKQVTLAVARNLRRLLTEPEGRYRVVLTRDTDRFLRLRERVQVARAVSADLFISLHADSIGATEIRGASVYTLSETASDREAEMLAAKENRVDAIGGMDLSAENDQVVSILIDLAQRDSMNHSRRFAQLAIEDLGRELAVLPRPKRSAGFAVLTAPDVPSILVEMGFLSNPVEARLLVQSDYRRRIAVALAHSIDRYFRWLRDPKLGS